MTSRLLAATLFNCLVAAVAVNAEAPFTIVVVDLPGQGFNDPTPAEPVGGNTGVTVGEQRLIAFRFAAAIWSSKLESPVPIRIRAGFSSLVPCTEKSAILAVTATPEWFSSRVPHPEMMVNVWYPASLANRLAEQVLDPDLEEITIIVNPNIGQPDCLPTQHWYYGLDNRGSATAPEMVTTLLHELAHGLGFGPSPHDDTFAKYHGRGDVYTRYLLDSTTGKNWNEMSDEERLVSSTNTRGVVWDGINVLRAGPNVLQSGAPRLRISGPGSLAGDYYVGTATFGAPLRPEGLIGEMALALDEANAEGPLATDACSPLLNVSEVAGRIALADRGTCSFVQKAKNVQAAGAVGLIVVNNVDGTFPVNLNGTDPDVTLTAVHVTMTTGGAIKSAMSAFQRVTADLLADPAARAGADLRGRPFLFTPNPIWKGSTISHSDPMTSPNQLMEPDIQDDFTHEVEPPRDLTLPLLRDLGWFSDFDGVPDGVDECPGSDRAAMLTIGSCNTRVENTTAPNGCRLSDYLRPCSGMEPGSEQFASSADSATKAMSRAGVIGTREFGRIEACLAGISRR